MPSSKSGPKYVRIKNAILQDIREGHLAAGNQIHSISKIMERFKVSKVTAVRALAELEVEGIVKREHGRGTFVMPPDSRSPKARARRSIAVVVPEMSNPFHVEVVGALERRLRDQDVAIELSCTDYDVETEQTVVNRLGTETHISGAVLISTPRPHELFGDAQPRFPLVVIDYCPPDLLGKCVYLSCDNFRGGFEAAKHLADLGHRRIGFVHQNSGSQDRLDGFRRGLEEHGLSLPENRLLVRELGKPLGEDVVDVVRSQRLTALFTHNDMLAMQAMQLLRARGFSIPGDISLIGYDDVLAARYLEVPLTTIDQHEELIGRKAAECLLEGLEFRNGAPRPREIVFVPQLVVRASTAPPP